MVGCGKTYLVYNKTYLVYSETCVVYGKTYVVYGETCVVYGKNCEFYGETCVVGYGENCEFYVKTCEVNGKTHEVYDETFVSYGKFLLAKSNYNGDDFEKRRGYACSRQAEELRRPTRELARLELRNASLLELSHGDDGRPVGCGREESRDDRARTIARSGNRRSATALS